MAVHESAGKGVVPHTDAAIVVAVPWVRKARFTRREQKLGLLGRGRAGKVGRRARSDMAAKSLVKFLFNIADKTICKVAPHLGTFHDKVLKLKFSS